MGSSQEQKLELLTLRLTAKDFDHREPGELFMLLFNQLKPYLTKKQCQEFTRRMQETQKEKREAIDAYSSDSFAMGGVAAAVDGPRAEAGDIREVRHSPINHCFIRCNVPQ